MPWSPDIDFADQEAYWIWNKVGASLPDFAKENPDSNVVSFFKIIDRDVLMPRTSLSQKAILHIIADGDTTCTVNFNNVTLGVFTGGFDLRDYPRIPVDIPQVFLFSYFYTFYTTRDPLQKLIL